MIFVLLIVAVLELGYIFVIHALLERERKHREKWMSLALDAIADVRKAEFLMADTEREIAKLEDEAKRLVMVIEAPFKQESDGYPRQSAGEPTAEVTWRQRP